MKVEKVNAFKSDDGCIWEFESDAIENNINNAIWDNMEWNNDNTNYRTPKLKKWFKENKAKVKYILANIDKINVED
mgnify:CR=1 FL=1